MPNNITEVRLIKTHLENDYAHTMYFDTPEEQQNFFERVSYKAYTDFSYQRKDEYIRIPDHYDNVIEFNYVAYKNSASSNKWFYAFITDTKYVNEERTDIYIETDVIQTWFFQFINNIKPSFIEREHVLSDGIGEHIVDEGLQLSEYITNSHNLALYGGNNASGGTNFLLDSSIVVGVTQIYEDGEMKNVKGTMYDGIYSGIKYYCFENDLSSNNGIKALDSFLNNYVKEGAIDSIVCIFLAPKKLASVRESDGTVNHAVISGNLPDTYGINEFTTESEYNHIISFTNSIDGYTPRNKKLLTNPYRYLLVSNNNGGSVVYNYEDFYSGSGSSKTIKNPAFKIEGALTPGCSIRMIPLNYKGCTRNDNEGINMGKYPILNWTSDIYTNWLTQNGMNIGLSVAGSVAQMGIGIAGALLSPATGGLSAIAGASAVASGVMGITSTMSEINKMSMTPPQAEGNINSGDIVTSTGRNDFHFYQMSIKRQCAEMLDSYFDMFGYKVNQVKIPNKNHRTGWWYTKTIDIVINAQIPQKDLQKIKSCYNNGITFWRDSNIRDYSKDNSIL